MLQDSSAKGVHVASELHENHEIMKTTRKEISDYTLTVRYACSGTDGTIFDTIERITEVSPVE